MSACRCFYNGNTFKGYAGILFWNQLNLEMQSISTIRLILTSRHQR